MYAVLGTDLTDWNNIKFETLLGMGGTSPNSSNLLQKYAHTVRNN